MALPTMKEIMTHAIWVVIGRKCALHVGQSDTDRIPGERVRPGAKRRNERSEPASGVRVRCRLWFCADQTLSQIRIIFQTIDEICR